SRVLRLPAFLLPVSIVALFLFSGAIAWVLSAVAVIVPDIVQITNVSLLLAMFVSPVGFSIDMVPRSTRALIYLNPLTYLIEAFRFALLGMRTLPLWTDAAF